MNLNRRAFFKQAMQAMTVTAVAGTVFTVSEGKAATLLEVDPVQWDVMWQAVEDKIDSFDLHNGPYLIGRDHPALQKPPLPQDNPELLSLQVAHHWHMAPLDFAQRPFEELVLMFAKYVADQRVYAVAKWDAERKIKMRRRR